MLFDVFWKRDTMATGRDESEGSMAACAHCHSVIHQSSKFCSECGVPVGSLPQMTGVTGRQVVVDTMLFGGTVATLGASTVVSVPAGIVLGLITYRAQRHWYGDDRESAMLKGLIVGLLTAIPTSLPGLLTIPSGIVGLLHMLPWKRKNRMLT